MRIMITDQLDQGVSKPKLIVVFAEDPSDVPLLVDLRQFLVEHPLLQEEADDK